jgi:hypothetical protein
MKRTIMKGKGPLRYEDFFENSNVLKIGISAGAPRRTANGKKINSNLLQRGMGVYGA